MMNPFGVGGTVKIIPAASYRDHVWNGDYMYQDHHLSPGGFASPYPQPINAAYYMGGMYNYMHEPYGQNAYIDAGGVAYDSSGYGYHPQYNYNYSPYSGYPAAASSGYHAYPGAYGAHPAQSMAYTPYPQPQPSPPRRSRTAPSRVPRSSVSGYPPQPTVDAQRRPRGYSADPYDPYRHRATYKVYPNQPQPQPQQPQTLKKVPQQYKKKREERTLPRNGIQVSGVGVMEVEDLRASTETLRLSLTPGVETEFGGGPVDYNGQFKQYYPEMYSMHGVYPATTAQHEMEYEQNQTLRRMGGRFYSPSYSTYPPSTMHRSTGRKKLNTSRYPRWARIAIKLAEIVVAAAVLGLVLGPMHGNTFHDFVIRTGTEWQGCVVGITASFGILSVIMCLTAWPLADKIDWWRRIDAYISIFGILGYLVCAFLEAYFAACYPPNGPRINLVCHRAEWIIATVLLFIQIVLYVIDISMSWFAGFSLL